MTIFNFDDTEAVGKVVFANSGSATICITNFDRLERLQVNQLVAFFSSKPGRYLIGIVMSVSIKSSEEKSDHREYFGVAGRTVVGEARISLIGTFLNRIECRSYHFHNTLEAIPEIGGLCFSLEGEKLDWFMRIVSDEKRKDKKISFGRFLLHENSVAYLDLDKFFQRHAMIAGTTGSGKSWTTAKLLEEISKFPYTNAILFDVHGEYETLSKCKGFKRIGIMDYSSAKDNKDTMKDMLYLPYWLLEYEDLIQVLGISSMRNALRQEALIRQFIGEEKERTLRLIDHTRIDNDFDVSSPIPFNIDRVIDRLCKLNEEIIYDDRGNRKRRGPYNSALTGLIMTMKARINDHRLAFLFLDSKKRKDIEWQLLWHRSIVDALLLNYGKNGNFDNKVKIVNFSNVATELLPMTVNLIAQILFQIGCSNDKIDRHPMAIFCDEANLYMERSSRRNRNYPVASDIFERIAREGRKHGISLVVVCQRPSQVNDTVLSQCNNVIVMRLIDERDQKTVRGLLPENIENFSNLLSTIGVGEAIFAGDACLLATRILITKPSTKPSGQTVNFCNDWQNKVPKFNVSKIASNWLERFTDGYEKATEKKFPPSWKD